MTEDPETFTEWRERTAGGAAGRAAGGAAAARSSNATWSRVLFVGVLSLLVFMTTDDLATRLLGVALLVLAAELTVRGLAVRDGAQPDDRRLLALRGLSLAMLACLVLASIAVGGPWYGVVLVLLVIGDLDESPSLLRWLWSLR